MQEFRIKSPKSHDPTNSKRESHRERKTQAQSIVESAIKSGSLRDKIGIITYKGDLRNGKKHGRGVQIYADKSRYEGTWKNDMAHGYGKLEFANGDVYEGTWLNDKAHGNGTYKHASGLVYKG